MNLRYVDIFFQMVAFLFAVSFHESAHAWTADQCGDDTARMLGRVSLNPVKHIDPIGTLLLPLIGLFTRMGMFGWGKPCPVNSLRLRDKIKSDILVSLAGPLSNAILVLISLMLLIGIIFISPDGKHIVQNMAQGYLTNTPSALMPAVWLLHASLRINVILGIFNLFPVPPLDGSHVITHILPEPIKSYYLNFGMIGLFALVLWGGPLLGTVISVPLNFLNNILLEISK